MTTVNEMKFTTKISKEVKELTWELEHDGMLATQDDIFKNARLNFNAGDEIGLPTEWQFHLAKTDDKVAIYLKLIKSPPESKTVYARFRYQITDEQYEFPEIKHCKPWDFKASRNQTWGFRSFIPSLKELTGQGSSRFSFLTKWIWPQPLQQEAFGANDNMKIRLQFTLYNGLEAKSNEIGSELVKFHEASAEAITQDLGKLLDSGDSTDTTIQLKDGRTLKAHKAILIARSPVFAAMLQTQMTELSSGIVVIEDLSFEGMSTILHFIYTGKLDGKWEENLDEIIYAADKYALMLLKNFCDKALGSCCEVENAWELLTFAERHGLETAEKEIKDFIKTNIGNVLEATKDHRHQVKRIKLDVPLE